MATVTDNGQTCLEVRGREERNEEIVRSDYNINDQYSAAHEDAISDGDPQGKGTNHGGHLHWLPDCTKPTNMIDYSNFDTSNGGGQYDIEGRNGVGGRKAAFAMSMYNPETPYGATLIDTTANIADGQYVME